VTEPTQKENLVLNPIGYFSCEKKFPYEAASQGTMDLSGDRGLIELEPGFNFEQAVRGLAHMSHLWVMFWFHNNENWKPLVMVPRGSTEKQGVFATRSPHRPNPVGLSLVKIDEIDQRKIWVRDFDLLDGTPILDLKPYHPEADVAINPKLGWMEKLNEQEYAVSTTAQFDRKAQFLYTKGVKQLVPFCGQQLRFDPFNQEKKRVTFTSENDGIIAYRTWRIHFYTDKFLIRLETIRSGYTDTDLKAREDKWNDKEIHREFIALFGR
jgi:tRNA-Thr(GGU) m(6)t(6)A37 methyltransferase TsaA